MLIEDDACTLEELERRARRFLRTGFDAMFTDRVEVGDASSCGIAPRTVVTDGNGRLRFPGTCRKDEAICGQIAFLDRYRDKVLAAADALLGSTRDADQALGRKAQQLMASAEPERKGSNCYGAKGLGGDISIAAECEPGAVLLTTDQSFDLICPAMGIEHMRFVGTRMPEPALATSRSKRRKRRKK